MDLGFPQSVYLCLLSLCLSVRLPVCPCVHPVCQSVCLSACLIDMQMCFWVGSRSVLWDERHTVVIFFSLTEAPLPDPTLTPRDPKRTRSRPETEPNGAKQSRNGAEMDRNQAFQVGRGGVVGVGGAGGCKGKRKSLTYSFQCLSVSFNFRHIAKGVSNKGATSKKC